MRCSIRLALAITGLLAISACGSDTTGTDGPQFAVAAGEYAAGESFGTFRLTTVNANGQNEVIDWLARGAFIELELVDDGTTRGRFFVPGGDEDGGDFDADLTGTWSIARTLVRLAHEADTVLREMDFRLGEGVLTAEDSFGGTTVSIGLVRK